MEEFSEAQMKLDDALRAILDLLPKQDVRLLCKVWFDNTSALPRNTHIRTKYLMAQLESHANAALRRK